MTAGEELDSSSPGAETCNEIYRYDAAESISYAGLPGRTSFYDYGLGCGSSLMAGMSGNLVYAYHSWYPGNDREQAPTATVTAPCLDFADRLTSRQVADTRPGANPVANLGTTMSEFVVEPFDDSAKYLALRDWGVPDQLMQYAEWRATTADDLKW